ncbi:MAG: AP2 domain-containing protein [Sedimentisphaerales bacterium]|nr:AP2 domain-containing protein [Sedimentisphaerales bacterium]
MITHVNVSLKIPVWLDRICTWPVMAYRRCKFGYSFRRIDLGEGEWTIVEPDDYYRLKNFKWFLSGNGTKFYAARSIKIGPGQTKIVRLHREIMNPPPGLLVDHRNGNGLDNRRANLRPATHSQNMYNKPKTKSKTSSRFIGVTFNKGRRKWETRIYYQKRKIWLGRFDDEIDAARAYDKAALEYHGEFARLNFS